MAATSVNVIFELEARGYKATVEEVSPAEVAASLRAAEEMVRAPLAHAWRPAYVAAVLAADELLSAGI